MYGMERSGTLMSDGAVKVRARGSTLVPTYVGTSTAEIVASVTSEA
jgi:hypothetical protein